MQFLCLSQRHSLRADCGLTSSVNSCTSAHRVGGALPMCNVYQLSCISCLTCTSGAAFTPRLLSMVSLSKAFGSGVAFLRDPLSRTLFGG